MSNGKDRAPGDTDRVLPRARDGRFACHGTEPASATVERRDRKRRLRTERDYLRRIVESFTESDALSIVEAIKADAIGGDGIDPKTTNAAREWVGKYLFGNARVPLRDIDRTPAIVKRK